MTVSELITKLQEMHPDDEVMMCVEPGKTYADIYWVERRHPGGLVCLCDEYWTPYAEEDLKGELE